MWILFALISFVYASNIKFVAVTGQCSREVPADRASLVLNAEVNDSSSGGASAKATKLYDKMRNEVKKLGLKNMQLQTSVYSVQPEYDYDKGKQRLRGYKAQMGLEVETSEIERMGEVIELGTKLGLQNVSGLRTFLSVSKRREEHEACLEEAIKNARAKAERMAKAGSAKLGEILTIEEQKLTGSPRPPEMYAAKMSMAPESSAPTVESRSQEIDVTIHVSFKLQ